MLFDLWLVGKEIWVIQCMNKNAITIPKKPIDKPQKKPNQRTNAKKNRDRDGFS